MKKNMVCRMFLFPVLLTRFSNIGIYDGITRNRLCESIKKNKKVKFRIDEELRLRECCNETINRIKNI